MAEFIPGSLKRTLKKAKQFISGLKYAGRGRYCPVCNRNSRKFGEAGINPREDAQCMYCGAVERHRLVWLYFKRKTNLFSGQPLKMLHIAPEEAFEAQLRKQLGSGYLSADIVSSKAMVKVDIMDIQYPDDSFDVIYCCHVLEHVPDDKKAMREFLRVLKPDGWAVLLVPINSDKTIEDPSITDPAERLTKYGDPTHVRLYGLDYIERLKEAGFYVKVSKPVDFLTLEEIQLMGVTDSAGIVCYCTKRHSMSV